MPNHLFFLQQLIDAIPSPIFYKNARGLYQGCNKAFEAFTGLSKEEIIGKTVYDIAPKDLAEKYHEMDAALLRKPGVQVYETSVLYADGTRHDVIFNKTAYLNPDGTVAGLAGIILNITERKQAEMEIRHMLRYEKTIAQISSRFVSKSDIDVSINDSLADMGTVSGAGRAYLFLIRQGGTVMDNTHEWCAEGVSPQIHNLQNLPADMFPWWMSKLRQGEFIHIPDVSKMPAESKAEQEILQNQDIKSLLVMPVIIKGTLSGFIGLDNVSTTGEWSNHNLSLLRVCSEILGNAIERKRAEDTICQSVAHAKALASINAQLYSDNLRQMQTITALYASAQRLAQNLNQRELAEEITRTCVEVFGVRLAWLGRAEEDKSVRLLAHYPLDSKYPQKLTLRWDDSPQGRGPTGRAIRCGSPVVSDDIASAANNTPWRTAQLAEGFCSSAAFPLISQNVTLGSLNLYSDRSGFFTPEQVELIQTYAHQAAIALEKARLLEETERRLKYLHALRRVDKTINTNPDLRVTFNVILDQLIEHLGIHAADILVLNQSLQALEYAAGRGFRFTTAEGSRLRLGEGYVGQALLDKRPIHISNLPEMGTAFLRTPLLANENFKAYFSIPLIIKGQIKGLLEVFHREPLYPDRDELDFMETLAGQAAIAIENTALLESIQHTNQELRLAYDATIESWARILDMRDKETEGHSQRVARATVHLSRAMGVHEAELVHVHRGALLHDIGKMGIPDHILLKPGPLSDEEWEIMRRHPVNAYEMLSPIEYLRPALDIPYCHHEKWDGTGYPRGLRGEQIPLSARIFAVIDVWDALRSDRPYRPALPENKVYTYIREQAGKHFDPGVVQMFFEIDWHQLLDEANLVIDPPQALLAQY